LTRPIRAAIDLAAAGSPWPPSSICGRPPTAPSRRARVAGLNILTRTVVTGQAGRLRVSGARLGALQADGSVKDAGALRLPISF